MMIGNFASSSRIPIGLIGAGAIGRIHAERARLSADVAIAAIADPSPEAAALGAALGVPTFSDASSMFAKVKVRAAIVATPNSTHAPLALECIAQGIPVLVEKPLADTLEDGERLCRAAEAANVPILVGHQRRHNPILRRARDLVAGGALGRPVAAHAMSTWLKPDEYFAPDWRRSVGAGPVLVNMIHDVDLLRWLLGEIVSVHAITSNVVRKFEVEDSAAVLLRFASGVLATLLVSDTAVAPWNWDLSAGEAAHYPQQDVESHWITGTEGSLTLPRLTLWRYRGNRGWHEELSSERTAIHRGDPYLEQLRHFRSVVEGRETPVCSGRDGLATLCATLAVHESARSGMPVSLVT